LVGGQRRASGGGADGAARHQEAQQGVTRLYEESTSQSPLHQRGRSLNSSPSPTADSPPLARLGLGKRHRSSRRRNVWIGLVSVGT
jgi:hypothetical protein